MKRRYYKRITILCLVFSLIFSYACYADDIIDDLSVDGVDPVAAPVAGAEKDLQEIFDLDQINTDLEDLNTVNNEGDQIEDLIPVTKPVEPVVEPAAPVQVEQKKVEDEPKEESDPEEDEKPEASDPEIIFYAAASEDTYKVSSDDEMLALSTSSNKALYDLLDCLSINCISINEALNEQRILIEGINEQLSKDSKRDADYQKEIKQYLMAIKTSLSLDLVRSISADDIHVNVSVDTVSASSVSEDTVSEDTVSEDGIDEFISTNRLYINGASSDRVPVELSSNDILTVSVSNISGNISGNDVSASTDYIRNIFYVLIIIALFLAMIVAMMLEQIFFRRLHG